MKTLYLLRHADRESGIGLNVHLTEKGVVQALALGKTITDKNLRFDRIFCSPSKRTQDTALHAGLSEKITLKDTIFEASYKDIYEEIIRCNDDCNSLLIIGHAPGIPHIIQYLASAESLKKHSHLMMSYRPCTLTAIDFDTDHWADISNGDITFVQEPDV